MISTNRVQLTGKVLTQPEVGRTQDGFGRPVARFRLVTQEVWRDREKALRERLDIHTIVVLQEALVTLTQQLIIKGSFIAIEGVLQHRTFEGNDGIIHTNAEIVLHSRLHRIYVLPDLNVAMLPDPTS